MSEVRNVVNKREVFHFEVLVQYNGVVSQTNGIHT
jgi:hypothetical protein